MELYGACPTCQVTEWQERAMFTLPSTLLAPLTVTTPPPSGPLLRRFLPGDVIACHSYNKKLRAFLSVHLAYNQVHIL